MLTAMVMQGDNSARTVITQLDLNSADIQPLCKWRNVKDNQDVRTCFIHFIMSFFLVDNKSVWLQVVEQKGCLQGIFESMMYDKPETIQLVFSMLDKVVEDTGVSKTQKVRLFNEDSLKHFYHLYHWRGPQKWKEGLKKDKEHQEEMEILDDEDSKIVTEVVHRFLMKLCCSTKNGINFFDKTYGMSGRNQNRILYSLLTLMTKAYDHKQSQELVIGILSVCPDQLQYYLPLLKGSLTLRPSIKWVACMDLVIQLYKSLPEVPQVLAHPDTTSAPNLVTMATIFVLPPPEILSQLIQGFKHQSLVVHHKVLQLVKVILQRAGHIIKHLSQLKTNNLEHLEELFREKILKAFPDLQPVFMSWEKIMSPTVASTKGTDADAPPVERLDHAVLVEQVIYYYQALSPRALTSNPGHLTSLLDGARQLTSESQSQKDEKPALLKLHLLKILASTDTRRLPWTKESQSGHTLMYLLLEMLVDVKDNAKLSEIAQILIVKVLLSTGLFEDCDQELNLWLEHLTRVKSDSLVVLSFLSHALTSFLSNPYPYLDRVMELCADAASLSASDGNIDGASVVTADDAIDAILEMDEEDWEKMDVDSGAEYQSGVHRKFPFSPLCVVVVDILKSNPDKYQGVSEFVCQVLLDVLHTQIDPVPLSLLVSLNKDVLLGDSNASDYIISWLPSSEDGSEDSKSPSPKKLKTHKSKKMTIDEGGKLWLLLQQLRANPKVAKDPEFMNSIKNSLLASGLSLCPLHTQMLLLYIRQAVNSQTKVSKKSDLLQSCFKLLLILVDQLCDRSASPTLNDSDSSESDENSVLPEGEFALLDVRAKTKYDYLMEVLQTIFAHPSLLYWFLEEDCGIGKKTSISNKASRELSGLFTDFLHDLFEKLSSITLSDNVQHHLNCYVDKLHTSLYWLPSNRQLQQCKVLECVSVVLPYLNNEHCQMYLDTLLEFPADLLVTDTGRHELTLAGRIVVQLATMSMKTGTSAKRKQGAVMVEKVEKLFDLLRVSSDRLLDTYCTDLVSRSPASCLSCSGDLWRHLLDSIVKERISMMKQLLIHNDICKQIFEEYVLNSSNWLKRSEVVESGLIPVYLRQLNTGCLDKTGLSNKGGVIKALQRAFFKNAASIVKETNKDHLIIATCLVETKQIENKKLTFIWDALTDTVSRGNSLSSEHIRLLQSILEMLLETDPDQHQSLVEQTLILGIKQLQLQPTDKQHGDETIGHLLALMLRGLEVKPEDLKCDQLADLWPQFVKGTMRDLYMVPDLHHCLAKMVALLYKGSWDPKLPIDHLHEMVLTHTLFTSVMFGEHGADLKDALVSLLLVLIEQSTECCQTKHIGLLLGGYGATLSLTDQKILKIIHLYEINGADMLSYKPYLWGPKAAEHQSLSKYRGWSLSRKPSTEQILENLDQQTLYRSIHHFPLHRTLQTEVLNAKEFASDSECYDPCFLLPLFSQLLDPENVVDCRKFVEIHCLGYCIAALSCHDSNVRSAAYTVLAKFYHHLEGARFNKNDVVYLMDLIQTSITAPNQKLACIITIFLARVARQLLQPENHMYKMLNAFLLLKPRMDLVDVPEFYKLFNSSAMEFKQERNWILSVLADGLRETTDYRIYQKRFVMKLLLSFHDSALSDKYSQTQVWKLMKTACSIPTVAKELTKTNGIVTWLTGAFPKLHGKPEILQFAVDALVQLWNNLQPRDQTLASDKQKHIPLQICQEMLLCIHRLKSQLH